MSDEQIARLRLESAIAHVGKPPPEQLGDFTKSFGFRRIPKGSSLVCAGERTSRVWFLSEGVVRMFYVGRDGREFNKAFLRAGQFAAALDALITSEPSRLSIQTMTECSVLEGPYDTLVSMYARDAFWERLGRVVAEGLYVAKVRREAALLMDSAGERYDAFLKEMSDLVDVIPNYHVASYLGVQPETLSRIRAARVRRSARE